MPLSSQQSAFSIQHSVRRLVVVSAAWALVATAALAAVVPHDSTLALNSANYEPNWDWKSAARSANWELNWDCKSATFSSRCFRTLVGVLTDGCFHEDEPGQLFTAS